MKQLKDYIPHSPDVRTYATGMKFSAHTLVGIEVELEKYNLPPTLQKSLVYWRAEHDGSLRDGGIEFVLAQPLTGADLEKAVEELYGTILQQKYEVNQRCSTHVHIDARNMSVEHMRIMVFVYAMIERMLYDYVLPIREDSFYCTPLYKSFQHRKIFANALDSLEFEGCPKYSGLNLRTLRKYGSLEFRMLHGLDKSVDLVKWLQVLLQLKAGTQHLAEFSMKTLLDRYSQNSAESIIREVFGSMADELLAGKNYNARLKDSMRSAQDLILLSPNNLKTLRKEESTWLRELASAKGAVADIDPELLEALREKRDEILAQMA